jgi:NADP-dependent 3-hydroxy acid dehydrogenase YdfG
MPIAPIAALKVEEWDHMIDVNVIGLLYGVAAVLPIMQRQKRGHIINIASVLGIKVFAPAARSTAPHNLPCARSRKVCASN